MNRRKKYSLRTFRLESSSTSKAPRGGHTAHTRQEGWRSTPQTPEKASSSASTRCFLWWRPEQRLNSIFGSSTTLAEEPKTPTCPRLKRPRRRSPFSRNRQFTRAWLRQVLRVLRPLRKEAPFLLRARTRMESSTVFQRQCSLSGRRQSKVHTHSLHLRNSGKPYTAQHRGIRHQNTSPISSTRSSSPPRTSRTLSRCAAATLNSFSDKIFRSASRSGTAERCDFSSPSHSHSES